MRMHGVIGAGSVALLFGLCSAVAQSPAPAGQASAPPAAATAPPAGATARCNDGSYSTAKQKWQACGGHKGVATWFADAGKASGAPAGAPGAPAAGAAPGGGPGMVWVNLDTKVYHCPGGRFYGKTKNGKYMSEADAKAAGDRPDRGKACGK